MRKHTRLSPLLRTASDEKLGGGPGNEATYLPTLSSILPGAGGKTAEKVQSGGEEKTYLTLNISAELPSIGIELYRRDKAAVRTLQYATESNVQCSIRIYEPS